MGPRKRPHVYARILWPALGFPAVIAPRNPPSSSPMRQGDATRCICVLLLSNRKFLSKAEAARHLRYVPWRERNRRHIPSGEVGSFAEEELAVRNDASEPELTLPNSKDSLAELIAFGGNADGKNSITVSLAHYVRQFYRRQGLAYLHEIRIDEGVSGRLKDGLYHLFWNNQKKSDRAPSDEMKLLIRRFARPRRERLAGIWKQHSTYLLNEYEYEYGALHRPYSVLAMRRPRAELLHPLFVQRPATRSVKIGHITDLHVHVRADAYEENLKDSYEKNSKGTWVKVSYNNWNKSFGKLYDDAKQDCDLLLLTGDLIDYGRGHWGQTATQRLGQDRLYHVDRNWFLFYYLLASGDAYQKPVYTILGNHDWRLNPYPPFAVAGAPKPNSLIHNYTEFSKKTLADILRRAHGPGYKRKFSYYVKAENEFELLMEKPGDSLKALARMVAQTRTMDEPHTPTETTVESVAWYLLSINPFLDYAFSLPGGYKTLMLDWAEDEDVLFPIVQDGKTWPYMVWQAGTAAGPGPKTRNSLTALQQRMVEGFIAGTGRAKVIGIHAPLIGPYPDWYDHDLLRGRKSYSKKRGVRGPTNYATVKPGGLIEKWNGHPLFAVRPKGGARGMEANYGSLGKRRAWFIKKLANRGSGVRLVLSGHIHRNGLYVVHVPGGDPKRSAVAGQMLVRGVVEAAARGARPPAVTLTPEGRRGPLYVNTTSAGPRGNFGTLKGRYHSVAPGYTQIELSNDGTIRRVQFQTLTAKVTA